MIALVDCNAFFCSCERLFRPDLLNVPVGVLSNNDGIFVSRTKELKALGVGMEPYFKVKSLCQKHKVAVFSSNFSLYTNLSDRVMSTVALFAPELEIYSIDEAFLDLSGFENFDLEAYGQQIKDTVMRHTGIPVSVGIAETKTLAKIANNRAKKDAENGGVVVLKTLDEIDKALIKTPVEDIWGVGKATTTKLHILRIKNAKEYRDYKNDKNIQKIFTKTGRQTQDELRGVSCLGLNLEIEKKKEIMCTRTFGAPVFDLNTMRQSIANYVTSATEKLRNQDSVCSTVEIFFQTDTFKDAPQHFANGPHKFQTQTQDTRRIIKYSLNVLEQLFRYGYEFKRAGVKISGIDNKTNTQISLFEQTDSLKAEKLMKVIDRINAREGKGTIKSAACGVDNKSWKMKQNLKSPRYLTGWNQIPDVH